MDFFFFCSCIWEYFNINLGPLFNGSFICFLLQPKVSNQRRNQMVGCEGGLLAPWKKSFFQKVLKSEMEEWKNLYNVVFQAYYWSICCGYSVFKKTSTHFQNKSETFNSLEK